MDVHGIIFMLRTGKLKPDAEIFDILLARKIKNGGLYPSNSLFPSNNLYPKKSKGGN